MTIASGVESMLGRHGVEYRLVAHPRTFSSKDAAEVAHVPPDHMAKAVMLGDATGLVMVVVPASHWIKLHAVQRELDRDLDLAAEETLTEVFPDCEPGAFPPLGPAYGLDTIVDEALTTLAYVLFEAGDHEHLVKVSGEDFRRLLGGCRHGRFSHAD